MKKIVVLYGENCAYCKKAKMLINRALVKTPVYSSIDISYIKDDSPEGKAYPHHYIPAFYCDGKHFFEGNPSMDDVKRLLTSCLDT